jgi:hypothetical protein
MQGQLTLAWVITTYHWTWKHINCVQQYCLGANTITKGLPMGVRTSSDIFQRIMYELLGDILNIQVYLDDILITSDGTFEEHAAIMEQVLKRLQNSTF